MLSFSLFVFIKKKIILSMKKWKKSNILFFSFKKSQIFWILLFNQKCIINYKKIEKQMTYSPIINYFQQKIKKTKTKIKYPLNLFFFMKSILSLLGIVRLVWVPRSINNQVIKILTDSMSLEINLA